jgi:hypothetical protein
MSIRWLFGRSRCTSLAHIWAFTISAYRPERCEISKGLLTVLKNGESTEFSRVVIGDESWFSYHYQSTHCYAKSCDEEPSTTKITIAAKRAMVIIFFTGTKLLVLDVLPREEKSNQNHFLADIAPELSKKSSNAKRRIDKTQSIVHTDNSMC